MAERSMFQFTAAQGYKRFRRRVEEQLWEKRTKKWFYKNIVCKETTQNWVQLTLIGYFQKVNFL